MRGTEYKEITRDQETRAVASVTARKEKIMKHFILFASGRNGGKKIQEVSLINNPKIVFKSDVPEEALNSLAAVFIEEIEKLLETEEGKAEFEKFMKEHSDKNEA